MKNHTPLLDFYINSSIHLSIAIVSLAAVTFLNFGISLDPDLLLFIFLASVTGYNFIKYAGIAKLHHRSLAKNLRIIQVFSFLIFICLVISAFNQPIEVLILAAIMGAFTLLYALPVFNRGRNLRRIPGIKIYVIAFVVAGVTVLMPLVENVKIFKWYIIVDYLQRFLLIIALLLPFEIRDLNYDMVQLNTLPQVLGVKGTKLLGYILTGSFIILEFVKGHTNLPYVLSILALGAIIIWFIKNSSVRQGKYYSSFWVEAIPIAWVIILWILLRII